MNIGKLKDKVQETKDAAMESANKVVDEFCEAFPAIQDLGLSVKDLKVGAAKGLPELAVKLVGTLADIRPEKIEELIGSNSEKKVLTTILKGLLMAFNVQKKVGDFGFKGLEATIKLGALRSVEVAFV